MPQAARLAPNANPPKAKVPVTSVTAVTLSEKTSKNS
jgi:hypothetical protein